jgi:cytosine/adenosine deaminase-related metal-dependent hydrolase
MLDLGCRVALGVDGKALDEDDDALRELRLAHLLHAGTGFKAAVSRKQMVQIAFAMACLMVARLRRECRPTSFTRLGGDQ